MSSRIVSFRQTRVVVLLVVLSYCVMSTPAWAAQIVPPSVQEAPAFDYLHRDWQHVDALRGIVDLLKTGERQRARLALGRFLSRQPRHPAALELAGNILLEDGNLEPARQSFERALAVNPKLTGVRAKLGVTQMLLGDHREGAETLRRVLAEDPMQPLALRYLGWFAGVQGDVAGAIRHHEHLVEMGEQQGRLTPIHLDLARLYISADRFAEVIELLGPRLSATPEAERLATARLLMARTELQRERVDAATEHVRELVELLGVEHPDVRLLQAELAFSRGNRVSGIQKLQEVVESFPEYEATSRFRLAQAYLSAGEQANAINELEQTVSVADPADLYQVLGTLTSVLLDEGQAQRALDMVNEQIAQHPELAITRYFQTEILSHLERYDDALDTLRELMREWPNFAPAYHLAGRLHWRRGNLEEAESNLHAATVHNPGFLDAWVDLASLQMAKGALEAAERTLDDALRANPQHPQLLFEHATVLHALGHVDASNQNYRTILDVDPTHLPALNNLASNLTEQGDTAQALPLAEAALRQAEGHPVVLDTYGWALLQSGDVKAALPLLERAARAMPEKGIIQYHLGEAYRQIGNGNMARQAFEMALIAGLDGEPRAYIEDYLR